MDHPIRFAALRRRVSAGCAALLLPALASGTGARAAPSPSPSPSPSGVGDPGRLDPRITG
ncbi:hypothetical protein [Streptomyces sp. ISL-94]|uniref:hypothetical protein n=1 Tax=Streptomyces sp. ISL-94 TaxID=2819190 RepID=UPI001BE64543|nr:hypothetical protein [Streptomyces sp. ISL-94]MBT2482411.1 hypothetical protein [Streptomyces sp. ISL-94]